MSAPRKAKTEFGIEVRVFTAQTGMTVKELAEKAGVKYTTLVETTTGRCAGHQLSRSRAGVPAEHGAEPCGGGCNIHWRLRSCEQARDGAPRKRPCVGNGHRKRIYCRYGRRHPNQR